MASKKYCDICDKSIAEDSAEKSHVDRGELAFSERVVYDGVKSVRIQAKASTLKSVSRGISEVGLSEEDIDICNVCMLRMLEVIVNKQQAAYRKTQNEDAKPRPKPKWGIKLVSDSVVYNIVGSYVMSIQTDNKLIELGDVGCPFEIDDENNITVYVTQ